MVNGDGSLKGEFYLLNGGLTKKKWLDFYELETYLLKYFLLLNLFPFFIQVFSIFGEKKELMMCNNRSPHIYLCWQHI